MCRMNQLDGKYNDQMLHDRAEQMADYVLAAHEIENSLWRRIVVMGQTATEILIFPLCVKSSPVQTAHPFHTSPWVSP